MTLLHVPAHPRPRISVAVVAYNAWEMTSRCLQAVVATAALPYELVVVDNASSDGTAAGLAEIEGAVLLQNQANLGFGVAANQAVMRARAPYVLLLNSDAVVVRGWDEQLAAILDSEADVAAVAARLLHPDGRLQEAGSFIWGDGISDNYGDGDSPDRPEYRFRRDVEYASAACMLVRRRDFIETGGFDPAFHPAYYEDVDLCFRWRQHGRRVIYQPCATAIHVRWGSSDLSKAQAFSARNLPLFMSRWATTLEGRLPHPELRDPACRLAMRDVRCAERFLVVTKELLTTGKTWDTVSVLLSGWPGARVTVVSTAGSNGASPREAYEDRGVEVATAATDPVAWLRGRRHHHTVILLDGEPSEAMDSAIAEAQPGAPCVQIAGSTALLLEALAEAGVEPERPGQMRS